MKIKLTIGGQPLVLTAKQAAVLFGFVRLREFAEGTWTPFVFCEPARADNEGTAAYTITTRTNVSAEELEDFMANEARETFSFADDVIAAAKESC